MDGMFKANGGCGYVKKPDFLLKIGQNNEVFDPRATLPVKTTLKVSQLLPVLLIKVSLYVRQKFWIVPLYISLYVFFVYSLCDLNFFGC